jgi:hypothetical protein
MDVKSALMNGILEEEVYVNYPLGFQIKGQEHKVYKLKKVLYSLKESPRAWYNHIDSYFLNNRFERSSNEPTFYTITYQQNNILIVCLYVNLYF